MSPHVSWAGEQHLEASSFISSNGPCITEAVPAIGFERTSPKSKRLNYPQISPE
jgi:hypothetical protein